MKSKMKSIRRRVIRQGDVVLIPIDTLPPGKLVKQARRPGLGLVLAEGEVTGHHHAIATRNCDLHATEESGVTVLEVRAAMAALTHDEHATVAIPSGFYRAVIKRQYSPEAIRRVQD